MISAHFNNTIITNSFCTINSKTADTIAMLDYCVVTDNTGTIRLMLWGSTIKEMEIGRDPDVYNKTVLNFGDKACTRHGTNSRKKNSQLKQGRVPKSS